MRTKSDRELHAIAGRFFNLFVTGNITAAQDKAWDGIISELEYRARHASPPSSRCVCFLCWNPFDPITGERQWTDRPQVLPSGIGGLIDRLVPDDRRSGLDRRRGTFHSDQERRQGDQEGSQGDHQRGE